MTELQDWRELVVNNAIEKGIDAERFRHDDKIVFWWNATLSTSREGEYIYWELRDGCLPGMWTVFGAVLANISSSSLSVTPFLFDTPHVTTAARQVIAFDIVGIYPAHAYNCVIELDAQFDAARYDMVAARVAVSAIPYPDTGANGKLLNEVEEIFHADQNNLADLPCPKCSGLGSETTFAIPQEEFDKGLKGYALYSANTINAEVACTKCGGEGVAYKEWYLAEQPKLRLLEQKYRKGTGKVQIRRLPVLAGL